MPDVLVLTFDPDTGAVLTAQRLPESTAIAWREAGEPVTWLPVDSAEAARIEGGHILGFRVVDGVPVEGEVRITPAGLEAAREAAKQRIDAAAETLRHAHITPGSGQTMVYKAKLDEAAAFQATGTVGVLMQAEIGLTATSAAELAALWLTMDDQWKAAAAKIEVARLTAKAAVNVASTLTEIAQAEAMMPNSYDLLGKH